MAEKVNYSENFYAGADYGLKANYVDDFSTGMFPAYRMSTASLGLPTDPRTANQLKAISDKLNTGAKTIEASGVQAATWETVPDPHLEEIYRLKKLAGIDLTFHGPLVEPTGVSKQGWNESHREQAERQMWQAVERAHKMDPKGNLVVTFHSSNGLPDPETRVMTEVVNPKTGKKEMKEVLKEFWIVTNDGQFQAKSPEVDYFKGKDGFVEGIQEQRDTIAAAIEKQNKDIWYHQLQGVAFHANQGQGVIERALKMDKLSPELKEKTDEKQWMQIYKAYLDGKPISKILDAVGAPVKEVVEKQLNDFIEGDIYLKDSYQDMQKLFNMAYDAAVKDGKKEDLAKLDEFRGEIKGNLKNLEKPENLSDFASMLIRGVGVLRSIKEPETVKPLREFGIDKSSETFANVAFNAYEKFKNSAPIVSIENPPAGSGLSRAQDLRDIVEASRKKLQERLVKEQHLSSGEAKQQAEKLIGVTWDVGHINMIRKFGYGDKELVKETETIGEFINKVHLSDNFGMEHTELPMGMGNVPTKEMFEAMGKYNKKMDSIKKIVETGNWFGPQAFGNQTPFAQTLKSFGSPIYSMKMAPYWNQANSASGGYFSGYGQVLPEQHFSMYGAGFGNMPKELGGQMSGRSRVGGTPMD
jgi:sugar phosphate isomerase/epimerase